MVYIASLTLYGKIRRKFNSDRIDRLNHIYSAGALLIFAFIFLFQAIFDQPVMCLTAASDEVWYHRWFNYINTYCYVEDKYFISPNQKSFPIDLETRKTISIVFYPWILVIFLVQAFCFILPHWIWECFNSKTGISLRSIALALAINDPKANKISGKKLNFMAINHQPAATTYLLGTLKYNSVRKDKVYGFISPQAFLSKLYLFYKFAYLANAIGQLLFLHYYLFERYTFGGASYVRDIFKSDWTFTGNFPRVVYCDMNRRDDATGESFLYTSQCLLPFNMLYEFMFGIIWCWLVILIALDGYSFFKAFAFVYTIEDHFEYVWGLLIHYHKDEEILGYKVQYFVRNVLGKDGVITLRILSANLPRNKVSAFALALYKDSSKLFPNPADSEDKKFEVA